MSFINKYIKEDYHNYSSSKKIGNAIYSVGSFGSVEDVGGETLLADSYSGLITKLDLDGNVIWEKIYENDTSNSISFIDLIECDNGDIIVTGVNFVAFNTNNDANYKDSFLTRINNNGIVIWNKQIINEIEDPSIEFIWASRLRIVKVAYETYVVLTSKQYNVSISEIFTIENILYKIDQDGNILLEKRLDYSQGFIEITNLNVHSNKICLFGGKTVDDSVLFNYAVFVELDFNFNLLKSYNILNPSFLDETVILHKVSYSNNFLFLIGYSETKSFILKLSIQGNNLVFQNAKLFDTQYGIGKIDFNVDNKAIYIEQISKTAVIITKINHELNFIWSKRLDVLAIDGLIKQIVNDKIIVTSWDDGSGSYIGLLDSDLNSCITITEPRVDFLNAIFVIGEDLSIAVSNSEYLSQNFSLTTSTITSTKEEVCPTVIGNLDIFQIKSYSSLQSSNLYLQSAGSLGLESAKGFHLRWMLKGALQSHLPKGDYATTNANFNKPNDFVKIYRADYGEEKVVLDFNFSPTHVDNLKAKWAYTIDNNTFTIYFKNKVKYNQVIDSSIDPANDTISFLKNYGGELIEIENKTNLAFAITPTFLYEGDDSNSFVLELSSVEENKIASPKVVSLRQNKKATEFNNNKLVSENIRSIRFESQDATIEKLEFEFYFEFINKISSTDSWTYIGKHALTKEATVAYNRLEDPVYGDVNGKWLRYNDSAFVNVQNYKTKWNGAAITPSDRIQSVVEKYIDLSDNISNPLANEVFSLTDILTSSSPDYDPNSNETFELSNLNLLQIASLDYHVARMLGLGMLDQDISLHNGKFVYLAEYITFGDLEDGLGAREVQHVYCSLPTTIDDQRLSLPVDLKAPVPGIFYGLDTEAPQILTDAQGYSADGRTRFLTLYHEPLHEELANAPFNNSSYEFVSSQQTPPVYAGIEYKNASQAQWIKPELAYDRNFFNIDSSVTAEKRGETLSILLPEPVNPLFVHREKEAGTHHYNSYGINWFSRATRSVISDKIVVTTFPTVNSLLPPSNVNALLIRKESPLLLSSATEQVRLNAITGDKTLIRLLFEYNHIQELKDYHELINGQLVSGYIDVPDNEEQFAKEIEIFFRNEVPNTISGKIFSVTDDSNSILAIVKTCPYNIISSGASYDQIIPAFPIGLENNFVGSILLIENNEFIVHQAYLGTNGYPEFKVFKRNHNGPLADFTITPPIDELVSPVAGGMFVLVENMQNIPAWNNPSPVSFKVDIDSQVATVHKEEVTIRSIDGVNTETHLQKFRGIYENAKITRFLEDIEVFENGDDQEPTILTDQHLGIYKIVFDSFKLLNHAGHSETGNSVDWYNGVVRLHTLNNSDGLRKEFKVIRTENIGSNDNNLILYILDINFTEENPNYDIDGFSINIDEGHLVSYYPGYKVYLHKHIPSGLTETNILPAQGEGEHYSIFSLRSHDLEDNLFSKLSVPSLMFAQEINEPRQPELPKGGKYATRPDFFGKSTYTFNTTFQHKPYSVQFNRASDIQILCSIYSIEPIEIRSTLFPSTVETVNADFFKDGNDEFYVNRWDNLLGFNYNYSDSINQNGHFKKFPDTIDGISLPLPDSPKFISAINNFIVEHNKFYKNLPSIVPLITTITSLHQVIIPEVVNRNDELKVVDFVKDFVHNCFVPLTEVPVMYDYIKKEIDGYTPIAKKQVIRDRNGNLLKPDDPNFDMAPMMVVKMPDLPLVGNNEVQFTDFGIDGASNAKYFYAVRELDLQMKTSDYSPIVGPIRLVNTAAPTAPEIIKIIPVLENRILGITPEIQLEINSYPEVQKIRKINIYRASSKVDSLTIRTMTLIKVIDLETEGFLGENSWVITDDFADLGYVPFGDPLFYAITTSRIIEYKDREGNTIIDYAPSEASKVVLTNIVENYSPESPVLQYYSEPINVSGDLNHITLFWDENVYKGNYHLYKMNSQGNWVEIAQIISDKLDKEQFIINNTDSTGIWFERARIKIFEGKFYLHLELTNLNTNFLKTKSEDGSSIYHHFKVIAENTSGMFSSKENIVSAYNIDSWNDIGGIGDMIMGTTFIIV